MQRHNNSASGAIAGLLAGILATAVIVAGCSTERTAATAPPRPTTPAGWFTVVDDSQDIRITLPPWIEPFDGRGGIFANERPRPDGTWLQLMALGVGAMPQPGPSEQLEHWLEEQIAPAGPGVGSTRSVLLPAGRAILIERTVRATTADPWRLAAYGIRTPIGVAYLLIDGPPAVWTDREADVALIPMLIEFGLGR